MIHCVQKKRPKCFCNIFRELGRFWWHLSIVSWINLPPNHMNVFHFTWIMSRYYLVKLDMLVFPASFSEKETPEFIPFQIWASHFPDLNPVDYSVWETLHEEMHKTCITDLDTLKQRLRTRMGQAGSRRHCGSHSSVTSSPISVRQGCWWTFWAQSKTFVIVLLVIFVAEIDDIKSYMLYVGLFLHIVRSGVVM